METELSWQIASNRHLERKLHDLCTSASPSVEFIQGKYDRLRAQYEKESQRSGTIWADLASLQDQTFEIACMKM